MHFEDFKPYATLAESVAPNHAVQGRQAHGSGRLQCFSLNPSSLFPLIWSSTLTTDYRLEEHSMEFHDPSLQRSLSCPAQLIEAEGQALFLSMKAFAVHCAIKLF